MIEYPLAAHHAGELRTPSGLPFSEVTLEAAMSGRLQMEDLRVTAEALELQAQIAERVGRRQLADNLRRAAELVHVPEALILEIYNVLRPGRATCEERLAWAARLETEFQAPRCAALLREAS